MNDPILQAVQALSKDVGERLEKIEKSIQNLAYEVNKNKAATNELKATVNERFDRLEKDDPLGVLAMMNHINKKQAEDQSYTDKKFAEIEREIHSMKARLQN
ncbi:hypothetical protein RY280_23590 [Bacillus paralicheniformis]|uniref:hypothetical protein n=1 Tax=Bacillus paralicheniformis TaxID=1648923 RepID=UPI0020408755|nr:hypothetical protein [Bacillus paralicheniformis]MCM3425577.1 hypothetical protein [Bacillus paralicheniformis]